MTTPLEPPAYPQSPRPNLGAVVTIKGDDPLQTPRRPRQSRATTHLEPPAGQESTRMNWGRCSSWMRIAISAVSMRFAAVVAALVYPLEP